MYIPVSLKPDVMTEVGGMIVALFIAIVGIFKATKWKTANNWQRSFIILCIIGALILFTNQFKSWRKAILIEKVTAKFGEIEDLKGATIPKLCSGKGYGYGIPVSPNGCFMRPGTGPLFRLYIKNSKLFVDAIIRDKNLKPLAQPDRPSAVSSWVWRWPYFPYSLLCF